MKRKKGKRPVSLQEKYPSSEPCSCETCRTFCTRPGWWTVEEAARAISAGYGDRMMLEIAPEFAFGVLSHNEIAVDWRTKEGQELVKKWASEYGLYTKYQIEI